VLCRYRWDKGLTNMAAVAEKDRAAALTVGLSATVGAWILAAAFGGAWLDSVSVLSVEAYALISLAFWLSFSVFAHLLLGRPARAARPTANSTDLLNKLSASRAIPKTADHLCASECEKDKLAALTAGFAITMLAWLTSLSFLPRQWSDSLTNASPWILCAASVALWGIAGPLMYMVFRAARETKSHGKFSNTSAE
jgi:hypothetical protein